MKLQHIALCGAVAALWAFNFVVIRWGLQSYPPLPLASLRFAVAATAIFALPKPALSWRWLITVGMVWFTFQFGLLFISMQIGMPAGLASVLMHLSGSLMGFIFEGEFDFRAVGIDFAVKGRTQPTDDGRHFGLVVEDKDAVRKAPDRRRGQTPARPSS